MPRAVSLWEIRNAKHGGETALGVTGIDMRPSKPAKVFNKLDDCDHSELQRQAGNGQWELT
jgi:hypothetical protein